MLELRKIGNDAREACEVIGSRGAVLIDQRARFRQSPPQVDLGLVGRAFVHEIERKAERQHRQQSAGEKDAIGQR